MELRHLSLAVRIDSTVTALFNGSFVGIEMLNVDRRLTHVPQPGRDSGVLLGPHKQAQTNFHI
jgi:hypothetical protein